MKRTRCTWLTFLLIVVLLGKWEGVVFPFTLRGKHLGVEEGLHLVQREAFLHHHIVSLNKPQPHTCLGFSLQPSLGRNRGKQDMSTKTDCLQHSSEIKQQQQQHCLNSYQF